MIEKCSIGNMTNNIQNITLILLILILIIVIIYYLKNSNAKHNELIEKYTTTPTNIIDRTPDIYHSGALTEANRLSHFPTQGSPITLRTCQVAFNNDKTSKYEYQDEWQEIDMLEGVEVPVKIIGRDNTTNASTISNFSEKSRCYKELSSTGTNKYKYLNNDLIQYDKNHFISLTSNINGAPVVKNYMQMKFDVFGNNVNHYDNIRDSICSLNYSTTLRSGSSDSTSTLGNTELYRLKLTENKIIEYIEKITIDPEDNHIFNKDSSFGVANLIAANTGKYKYDTSSKLFIYEPSNASASNDIRTINLYQFERNLFCDKQEIKSYKKLDNAKIDMLKFINYGIPSSTYFDKTTIPTMYMTEPKYSTYISNITKVNSKTDVDGYLNDLITNELESLNTITSNNLRIKRDLNQRLIDTRTNFIEPSNNSKAKFIQNAIVKNNYDNNNTYKTLLNENNYNLDFGNVSYSGYSIVDNDASIKISEVNEPKLQEFISATAVTDDIWEVKIYKENGTFNLPVETEGCEILIVGGGGGGDGFIGGGGGGGAVLYATNITIPANIYTIKVGKGGVQNVNGGSSEAFGATCLGGGSTAYVEWPTTNNGTAGGSGSGSSSGNTGSGVGGGVAISTKGTLLSSGTLYNGNVGGNSLGQTASPWQVIAGGGGGAGNAGLASLTTQYTTRESYIAGGKPGKGGDGIPVNITGTTYYWGAGGGGGSARTHAGDGGLGGGGGGGSSGVGLGGIGGTDGINNGGTGTNIGQGYGGNGGANTGSGGGGGSDANGAYGGNGGSGIVIIRFKSIAPPLTEGNPITHKTLNFLYTVAQPTYTLDFPVPTTTDILERTAGRGILNNSNLILQGIYDINLTASSATIVPRTGQFLPFTATSNLSQNIGFRYHLLNPIKMPEGAQWTYNSNNANVYHLGNVGIGTTNPSYNLDVRGTIFTSTGGYTQSGLTTWTVMSDKRIKDNIVKASYDKCLENVKNIELYNFNFKNNCVNTNDKNQLGFIAQEVQQVYPKAVEVGKMMLNTNETIDNVLTLNTTQIKYTLYGAVKELINKVEKLETKINT